MIVQHPDMIESIVCMTIERMKSAKHSIVKPPDQLNQRLNKWVDFHEKPCCFRAEDIVAKQTPSAMIKSNKSCRFTVTREPE